MLHEEYRKLCRELEKELAKEQEEVLACCREPLSDQELKELPF